MRRRILRDLEQRLENILYDLLERLDSTRLFEDVVQSGYLNQPPHVVREQSVFDDPFRELVPFRLAATIDTDSILCHLVFALLKIVDYLLGDLGEITTFDVIVALEEDLPQSRLSERVVLEIEFVEAMERVLMGVHVERIDGEIVSREIERFKDLS